MIGAGSIACPWVLHGFDLCSAWCDSMFVASITLSERVDAADELCENNAAA